MNGNESFIRVVELWKRFSEWNRKRPLNMLKSIGIFIVVITGMVLFIKIVFPAIFVVAVLIYIIYDPTKFKSTQQPMTLNNEAVCWETIKFMLITFRSISRVLTEFAHVPESANDLYDMGDICAQYNDAPMLKLRLLRRNKDISQDEIRYIKQAMQSSAEARIMDGHLSGHIWALPSVNSIPLIKIALIDYSDSYVHIGVLLTNTEASARAAYISDKTIDNTPVDSTDHLFR